MLASLALGLMVSMLPGVTSAQGYTARVNGHEVAGANPVMRDGQLMVAIRPVVQALGGSVSWSQTAQKVTVSFDGSTLAVWLGSHTAYRDGQREWVPVAPYVSGGQMMVPGWWLASELGARVSFNGTTLVMDDRAPEQRSTVGSVLYSPDYVFPFASGAPYEPFVDTMGAPRTFDGRSFGHEGTDILAPKGTPIRAVASGKVVRYGWNMLGGYRLTVQLDDAPQYRFYYAHMDRYASGVWLGGHVRAGQIIGYTGNTGEGPERTEGHFVPHLHFGIYASDGSAIDSYPFLKFWERHKVQ